MARRKKEEVPSRDRTARREMATRRVGGDYDALTCWARRAASA